VTFRLVINATPSLRGRIGGGVPFTRGVKIHVDRTIPFKM